MYAKELIHLTDPRTLKWRFMFFRVALSVKKESKPSRIMFTNIFDHVSKDESHGVRIVKTSLRVFARMVK
jgi:hypothetical protein